MFSKEKMLDYLFVVQFICTLGFGGSQFAKMLTTSQGVSISWFSTWLVFLVLNLWLAVRAHRNQPSRLTRQTIASYITWIIMVMLDLGAMLGKGTGTWNARDNYTIVVSAFGIVSTLAVARKMRLPVVNNTDPMVKGLLAVSFKAFPQLIMAFNMFMMGGSGLSAWAVWLGHATVWSRIIQLWFSMKEAGWDRNRVWSFVSESANEASWMVVTAIWLAR